MSDDLRAAIHLLEQSLYSTEWADVFKFEDEGVYYVEITGAKADSAMKTCFCKGKNALETAKKALSLWTNDKYASNEEIYSIEEKKKPSQTHRIHRKSK